MASGAAAAAAASTRDPLETAAVASTRGSLVKTERLEVAAAASAEAADFRRRLSPQPYFSVDADEPSPERFPTGDDVARGLDRDAEADAAEEDDEATVAEAVGSNANSALFSDLDRDNCVTV